MKELEDNYVPPAREGGLQALDGQKIWAGIGIPIYTIPAYHHSFRLFYNSLSDNTFKMLDRINESCRKNCITKLKLLRGHTCALIEEDFPKCFYECSRITAKGYSGLNVLIFILFKL
jgi:hypothetical protein